MTTKNEKILGNGISYPGARPMTVHTDDQGNEWLCDKSATKGNYADQGCWRTDMMAFNRND